MLQDVYKGFAGNGIVRTQRRNHGANLARSQLRYGLVDARHTLPRGGDTQHQRVDGPVVVCPVISRSDPGDVREPDALTAPVNMPGRICEGANSIVQGTPIVTPQKGNLWQTGNTNRILNTREFALLTGSWLAFPFFNVVRFV